MLPAVRYEWPRVPSAVGSIRLRYERRGTRSPSLVLPQMTWAIGPWPYSSARRFKRAAPSLGLTPY
jgi:hypothetical protein